MKHCGALTIKDNQGLCLVLLFKAFQSQVLRTWKFTFCTAAAISSC